MSTNQSQFQESLENLQSSISKIFLGPEEAVEKLIICLIAGGHALIEDVPGIGKTLLATALAKSIDADFQRIQCTPDLLPNDVIGGNIFDRQKNEFKFIKGPIFSNIVLVDEINRATPRCQSSLLEAMNEKKVTTDTTTRNLPNLFFVLATQNSIDFSGTNNLPENQLDRFLMKFSIGYPSKEKEMQILKDPSPKEKIDALNAVIDKNEICFIQKKVSEVSISNSIINWIIAVAKKSREHPDLRFGLSTRATVALANCARALALYNNRDYVIPDDVIKYIYSICCHRIIPSSHLSDNSTVSKNALKDIIEETPSPI